MKAFFIALFASLPLLAGTAQAGAFSDLVLAPGVWAEAAEGPLAAYGFRRDLPAPAEGAAAPAPEGNALPAAVGDGRLDLLAAPAKDGMQLVLKRIEDGKTLPDLSFSPAGPNPVLLVFLEDVVRVMAAQTGGSPFYIRNRIREALGAADLAAGQGPHSLTLTPFAQDANRARMGGFADLAITITYDAATPGRVLELKADTPAGAQGYSEHLQLLKD